MEPYLLHNVLVLHASLVLLQPTDACSVHNYSYTHAQNSQLQ